MKFTNFTFISKYFVFHTHVCVYMCVPSVFLVNISSLGLLAIKLQWTLNINVRTLIIKVTHYKGHSPTLSLWYISRSDLPDHKVGKNLLCIL